MNASCPMHASPFFPPQFCHCFIYATRLIVLYSLQDNHIIIIIILLNLTCNTVHKSSIYFRDYLYSFEGCFEYVLKQKGNVLTMRPKILDCFLKLICFTSHFQCGIKFCLLTPLLYKVAKQIQFLSSGRILLFYSLLVPLTLSYK